MITGKTKSGFKFELDENVLDDWEYLEILSEIDEGKVQKLPKMFEMLLGKDQYKALKEFLRKDGKVSAESMANAFDEIMGAVNDLKN